MGQEKSHFGQYRAIHLGNGTRGPYYCRSLTGSRMFSSNFAVPMTLRDLKIHFSTKIALQSILRVSTVLLGDALVQCIPTFVINSVTSFLPNLRNLVCFGFSCTVW